MYMDYSITQFNVVFTFIVVAYIRFVIKSNKIKTFLRLIKGIHFNTQNSIILSVYQVIELQVIF